MTDICFFGGFETGYPRSEVLRKGLEKHGVRVRLCRTSPRRRGVVRAAVLAWKFLSMKRPFDVICVPEFRHKDVPLAWALARLTGKRLVFDPLVSRYDTKILDRADAAERSVQAWHNRNLDRVSLRLPDIVLADTAAHAEYYARQYGVAREKIRVVEVGFDEDVFDPALYPDAQRRSASGQAESAFVVLFFGNYLPLHGVDTIVAAAKELAATREIRFDLIGGGQTFPQVEEYVRTHRLTNVRLLDRVPMESLPRTILASDVCLGVFGRTEKAGRVVANKVYQAMAMGKPVITEDSPAVRERFLDGEDICLVPAGDPGALAERIRNLYGDRAQLRRIGERATERVRMSFSSYLLASVFIVHCEQFVKE
jgi:glycosyltransferase involved in cell wall biosynthesis